LERVDCDLCGSAEHEPVYEMPDLLYHPEERFTVVRCLGCGLGFVNPRPTAAEMARYYPASFYHGFEAEADYHRRRYARQAAWLPDAASFGREPRLLDVGCATGGFPRFMRARGWRVEGQEVSNMAAGVTDFPVHRRPLPELDLEPGSYDAITAWAVLEHVHTPMAYFRKAAELLRPGGRFAFLVTNFESASSHALFREDVPRHLYFFSDATLRRYFNAVGLELVRARNDGALFEMQPVHWLHWRLRRLAGRRWDWESLPATRQQWCAARGLPRTPANTLRFLLANPLSALDRALRPLYVFGQRITGRYGIITAACAKPLP
jgi:SAM-dependent methyltransferase